MGSLAIYANWLPDPTPEFGASPTPYIVLMAFGFLVGVFGHIIKSKTLVGTGIGLIFLAVLLLPLITNISKSS